LASMIVNAGKAEYLRPARFDYDVGERASSRHYPDYDVSKPTEKHRRIQRLVALWQMTYVGPPMIYYGTEAGMWGGDDPDDRMPMFWDDLGEYANRKSHPLGKSRPLDKVAVDRELHEYYRDVIRMRNETKSLRRGSFKVLEANDDQSVLVFAREFENEKLIVVLNRSENPSTVEVKLDVTDGDSKSETLLSTPGIELTTARSTSKLSVSISGTSGAVIRVR
ncbi:MAG: alpha-glucosidase C-terminal domain-containing protein, partial [Planctomycetota bacterium]